MEASANFRHKISECKTIPKISKINAIVAQIKEDFPKKQIEMYLRACLTSKQTLRHAYLMLFPSAKNHAHNAKKQNLINSINCPKFKGFSLV